MSNKDRIAALEARVSELLARDAVRGAAIERIDADRKTLMRHCTNLGAHVRRVLKEKKP